MRKILLIKKDDSKEESGKKKKADGELEDLFEAFSDGEILDPLTPTIYLSGEVTSKMAKAFRDAVRELEFERKSDIALIVIDSIGGSVLACFEILNTIKSSKIEFLTYNVSHAYSAGSVILSAGSKGKRFAAPLSRTMVHQISAGTGGALEVMRCDMKEFEAVNSMLVDELCRNCGISREKLEKMIKETGSTDLYLSPKEAKALGLVDEVGCVTLTQAKAYQLEFVTEEEEEEKPKAPKKKVATKAKYVPDDLEEEEKPKAPAKKPVKRPTKKKPVKR